MVSVHYGTRAKLDFSSEFPVRTPRNVRARINSPREVGLIQVEVKLGREWCAQRDDLRTFLREFVACLPQATIPPGLNL
jgi:hypothetical protein